jgi:hypothetical protein
MPSTVIVRDSNPISSIVNNLTSSVFGIIAMVIFFPLLIALALTAAAIALVLSPLLICGFCAMKHMDNANKPSTLNAELLDKITSVNKSTLTQPDAGISLDDATQSKALNIVGKLQELAAQSNHANPSAKGQSKQIKKELLKEMKTLREDVNGKMSKSEMAELKKSLLSQLNQSNDTLFKHKSANQPPELTRDKSAKPSRHRRDSRH